MAFVFAQNNLLNATSADAASFVEVCVSNLSTVVIQLAGTFTATVQFEATVNGTDYVALTLTKSTGGTASSATGTGAWQGNCGGYLKVRARCSAFTGGPIDASIGAAVNTVAAVADAADGQVLFMDGTTPGGDSGLTWDKTNKILTLAESSLAGIIVGEVNAISTQDGTSVVLGVNELDGNQPVLMLAGTEDTGGGQVVFHRSFGTVAAPTTVTPGNNVGGILFNGYNSVAGGFQMNANIFAYVPSNGLPHGLLQFTVSPGPASQIWSMTDSGGFILPNGGALQTDTTTAHTALLQAYDVDGAAYKTFATLTNGNTPDLTIAAPAGGTVTVQPTTYKSSDGSTGATGTATAVNTLTIKNGLVVTIA